MWYVLFEPRDAVRVVFQTTCRALGLPSGGPTLPAKRRNVGRAAALEIVVVLPPLSRFGCHKGSVRTAGTIGPLVSTRGGR